MPTPFAAPLTPQPPPSFLPPNRRVLYIEKYPQAPFYMGFFCHTFHTSLRWIENAVAPEAGCENVVWRALKCPFTSVKSLDPPPKSLAPRKSQAKKKAPKGKVPRKASPTKAVATPTKRK